SMAPMLLQVRRTESGEVSPCGIDEMRAAKAAPRHPETSRRRDHHFFDSRPVQQPAQRMVGGARSGACKVTTITGLEGSRPLMQGPQRPRFFPKLSLSVHKVLGFNRRVPFHRL
ncbi:hypothetical protein CC86DRAFT_297438, partial [Ophiobolus disseminans]